MPSEAENRIVVQGGRERAATKATSILNLLFLYQEPVLPCAKPIRSC
jgi:hypothetical protein